MKQIVAIIKEFKIHEVREALAELGLQAGTVEPVYGFGKQKPPSEYVAQTKQYGSEAFQRIRISLVVSDLLAAGVVRTIVRAAKTGRIGDGLVYSSNVETTFSITREKEITEGL